METYLPRTLEQSISIFLALSVVELTPQALWEKINYLPHILEQLILVFLAFFCGGVDSSGSMRKIDYLDFHSKFERSKALQTVRERKNFLDDYQRDAQWNVFTKASYFITGG